MPHLRIADLLTNAPIDPEAHLNAAKVERYAEMLDALPPVVVFDTEEGLLLADGYHRVEAARRRGVALRYAAKVGAAQQGISLEDAASYIRRRSQGHWTSER
jgi:hypothetical protein